MAAYIVYLVFLLSVLAFSPTRYFSFSYITLLSAIPAIFYCIFKYPSKILISLLLLFLVSVCSGWNNNFKLWEFGHRISGKEIIASSSIWLISFVTMKLSLHNKWLKKIHFHKHFFACFFILGVMVMGMEIMGGGNSMDEGSNSVYYVLPVLPGLMYYFPKYKYYAFMLVCALIILSIKRSAFLIIGFSFLWFIFCSFKGIINLKKSIIRILLLGFIGIISVADFASTYIDAIVKRFSGISQDGGSSRDLIYEYAWELFLQYDSMHQLFGNGPRFFWASSTTISAAHNDFLEIIVSCGIVGVILFICLHVFLIKILIKLVRMKSDIAVPMGVCYITFTVWNLIACQFAYQSPTVTTFMFFALVEYCYEQEKKNIVCCD